MLTFVVQAEDSRVATRASRTPIESCSLAFSCLRLSITDWNSLMVSWRDVSILLINSFFTEENCCEFSFLISSSFSSIDSILSPLSASSENVSGLGSEGEECVLMILSGFKLGEGVSGSSSLHLLGLETQR